MKILLIEDEPKLLRSIAKGLRENGMEVDAVPDGEQGILLAKENLYAVIVSDVIMPGINGVDMTRSLRSDGIRTPILLLTALRQTEEKVSGLDAGADDYLTKPFEFRELIVRLKALARRPVATYRSSDILVFADLSMNLTTKEVTRAGKTIVLTPREFSLLEFFLRNTGRIIPKSEISERVWDLSFDTGTNVVEVYVNFLRKKIDKGFDSKLIHTQFKTGYILREEPVNSDD